MLFGQRLNVIAFPPAVRDANAWWQVRSVEGRCEFVPRFRARPCYEFVPWRDANVLADVTEDGSETCLSEARLGGMNRHVFGYQITGPGRRMCLQEVRPV